MIFDWLLTINKVFLRALLVSSDNLVEVKLDFNFLLIDGDIYHELSSIIELRDI